MSFPGNTGVQCSYLKELKLCLFGYRHIRSHQFDPFTVNIVDRPVWGSVTFIVPRYIQSNCSVSVRPFPLLKIIKPSFESVIPSVVRISQCPFPLGRGNIGPVHSHTRWLNTRLGIRYFRSTKKKMTITNSKIIPAKIYIFLIFIVFILFTPSVSISCQG